MQWNTARQTDNYDAPTICQSQGTLPIVDIKADGEYLNLSKSKTISIIFIMEVIYFPFFFLNQVKIVDLRKKLAENSTWKKWLFLLTLKFDSEVIWLREIWC